MIGTLRRECLDHLIVLNEPRLRVILREFVAYYNADRPHRTLQLETPVPTIRASTAASAHDQSWAASTTCTSVPCEWGWVLPPDSLARLTCATP